MKVICHVNQGDQMSLVCEKIAHNVAQHIFCFYEQLLSLPKEA
jgi:hypothetical protein